MLLLQNDILINYVLPGLILAFGVCFLFILVPEGDGLRGYRMARRMIGCGYLAFFVALVIEMMGLQMSMPQVLHQMMMVFMGMVQAFLFTFALTTLIDIGFFTWQRFVRESLMIVLPAVVAFTVFPFFTHQIMLFILLAIFYSCEIIRYITLFRRRYCCYKQRMGDYFSADEWQRLRWVKRSFYAALAIGILALLYALYPSVPTSLLFTFVTAAYYAVFGIRFINYAFQFHEIETPLTYSPPRKETLTENAPSSCDEYGSRLLIQRLDKLMISQRLFTKPDLTIEDVAVQVGESYRSVSAAINSCEGINFKSWVNGYRIDEAKRLIRKGFLKDHIMDALALASGFANRTSFYRAFKRQTGQSPTDFIG